MLVHDLSNLEREESRIAMERRRVEDQRAMLQYRRRKTSEWGRVTFAQLQAVSYPRTVSSSQGTSRSRAASTSRVVTSSKTATRSHHVVSASESHSASQQVSSPRPAAPAPLPTMGAVHDRKFSIRSIPFQLSRHTSDGKSFGRRMSKVAPTYYAGGRPPSWYLRERPHEASIPYSRTTRRSFLQKGKRVVKRGSVQPSPGISEMAHTPSGGNAQPSLTLNPYLRPGTQGASHGPGLQWKLPVSYDTAIFYDRQGWRVDRSNLIFNELVTWPGVSSLYVLLSAGRFAFMKPIWVTHKGNRGVTIGELLQHVYEWLQESLSEEEVVHMREARDGDSNVFENLKTTGPSDSGRVQTLKRKDCLSSFTWWYGSIALVDGEGKCALHVATYDRNVAV